MLDTVEALLPGWEIAAMVAERSRARARGTDPKGRTMQFDWVLRKIEQDDAYTG